MNKSAFTPLYYFMNEQVSLLEIKINDISEDAPKDEKYYWLKIYANSDKLERLKFTGMSSEKINGNEINIRTFDSGELRFQGDFAKLILDEKAYLVGKLSVEDIPVSITKLLEQYTSSFS